MLDLEFLKGFGFFGIFLISFISNAIPYSTIPYLFWLIPVFALYQGNMFEYILLIILSSLGASMGKIVVYFIGRGFSRLGEESRIKRNLNILASEHSNALFITLLLFTALPLPDDVIILPLGYAKYNIVKYTVALLTGKIIVTSLAALYGKGLSFIFSESLNVPLWVFIIIYLYITLLFTYLAGSIDWLKLGGLAKKYGVRHAVAYFLKCMANGFARFHLLPLKFLRNRVFHR
ncbi:VTT domain-containing protein [Thermosphaera chiliense]|uniref:VTT domain-containing protein n=1 Tax=Thermosphaera chiliense TaxID=3402707 RepID=A0A7M1UR94_9CREN|nr:VTT domain-containing protein [Thermosphaera aggregans]QOR94047.1 VTT domain-containing protein [Thermosphaera aggregans]